MVSHGTLALLIGFGMCVLVPLGLVAALVYVVTRRARARHEERMAMIAQGIVPPADGIGIAAAAPPDRARGLGWAAGLIAAGVVWAVFGDPFAALLIGVGAAFLARGIIGTRSDGAAPPLPPGGSS